MVNNYIVDDGADWARTIPMNPMMFDNAEIV